VHAEVGIEVLVSSSRHIDQNASAPLELSRGHRLENEGKGMSRLEGGYDSFRARKHLESIKRFTIGCGYIANTAGVPEENMLRSYPGIVETGGNAVGLQDLPFTILKDTGTGSMKQPGGAA
jgi:hypothetical protein